MAPRTKKEDTGELQVSIEQYTRTRDQVRTLHLPRLLRCLDATASCCRAARACTRQRVTLDHDHVGCRHAYCLDRLHYATQILRLRSAFHSSCFAARNQIHWLRSHHSVYHMLCASTQHQHESLFTVTNLNSHRSSCRSRTCKAVSPMSRPA